MSRNLREKPDLTFGLIAHTGITVSYNLAEILPMF
jgi:hypothetical protein